MVGVDEYATRKGRNYGTILVDVESRRPVDLLPDREASSLAAWLAKRPGIEVVCFHQPVRRSHAAPVQASHRARRTATPPPVMKGWAPSPAAQREPAGHCSYNRCASHQAK
ncbi:transposase [Streptomyces sp. NPDC088762]|uniref:transposase n=1 Tax=Streptomyces sp. NPDC088762 TaxID=3365891 RepID=UPI00381A5C1B